MAQLKGLEVIVSDSLLVHYILYTFPNQYAPFKITFNTHKDKWSTNKLVTMYVQKEKRLLMEEGQMVNLTTSLKNLITHDTCIFTYFVLRMKL